MAIAADYGRHRLDLRLEEVMPAGPSASYRDQQLAEHNYRRRESEPTDSWMSPTKSQLLRDLKALIDMALARAGALNSDDDLPDLVALCDDAGLTLWEYESVVMRANGCSWKEIAKGRSVSVRAAREAADRGFKKLADFVLRRD